MAEKRTAAVAEVDRANSAGRLRWDDVASLVHPFPRRGVLAEHREGQEDEVGAPGVRNWSDRDALSSASEGLEDALCCACGNKAATCEASTVGEGEVAEKLRQVREMISQARELGHPRVVTTLQLAEHTLKRQL